MALSPAFPRHVDPSHDDVFLILWLSFQPSEARSFPYFLESRDHFVHLVALPPAFPSQVVPVVFVVTRSFLDPVALPPRVSSQVVGLFFVSGRSLISRCHTTISLILWLSLQPSQASSLHFLASRDHFSILWFSLQPSQARSFPLFYVVTR